jgi:hypothetical protein
VIFEVEILFRSTYMANKPTHRFTLPVANYSSAISRAVEWLGDRYLLAKPIKAAAGATSVVERNSPLMRQ